MYIFDKVLVVVLINDKFLHNMSFWIVVSGLLDVG